MAALMEKAFREGLPEETRVRDSKANEEYYLLRNTEVPAIILECGFLSCRKNFRFLWTRITRSSSARQRPGESLLVWENRV